jgi:nucleoside-diphosphate-sugar epimerase
MKLLILGGTVFLGRGIVEVALPRGHQLTLFNRGQSNPGLFPQVENLVGERDGGLEALRGRHWDAAIDTCGYVPRLVRQSARLLAPAVAHYTFISSISVYADFSQPGMDESAPVGTLEDETIEQVEGGTYGPLKALCEQAAEEEMAGRVLVVRPGLIVGPHDRSDRFTYWPQRVMQGGEVLAPGRPEREIKLIDVRDLAEWILDRVESGATGTFNANGPGSSYSMEQLLQTCAQVSGSQASFTWVSEEFLQEQKVGEWIEMPLWVPESDPQYAGFFAVSSQKAIQSGLKFRPLVDTMGATLDWAKTRPADYTWRAGISRAREAELLEAWHAREKS